MRVPARATSRCRPMPASARTRPARPVDVEHAVEAVEREQRPVGRHPAGERVAGARDAHRAARARRPRSARPGSPVARARRARTSARATSSTTSLRGYRRMSWEPELEELRRREALAREMGGAERVARQHASGRLTVRERIERLFDPGTFHETGALAGSRRPTTRTASSPTSPRRTWSAGRARSRAARAVVQGDDFTVRGGAADAAIWQKMVYAERLAHDLRLPLVRLVDGTGGGGSRQVARADGLHVRAVHPRHGAGDREPRARAGGRGGARAGGRAGRGAGGRLALQRDRARDRRSCSWPGRRSWPPRWASRPTRRRSAARGMQTRAGAVDNEAADEDDALDQLKRFLSYLPPSAWELPPIAAGRRPAGPPRRGAALDRPARPAQALRHARGARARCSTAARCSSSARATAAR